MGIWVVNKAEKMVLTFDPEVHEEAQVQLSPHIVDRDSAVCRQLGIGQR